MVVPETQRSMPEISVVVPVYEEQDNVLPLYEQVHEALRPLTDKYELIYVDDGSGDNTVRRVQELRRQDDRVRVLVLRRNFGQTAAMRAGIEAALGTVIVTMDGDLQNDPADIPRLVSMIDAGYDLAVGWRRDRQDPFLTRVLPSKIANWVIARLTGVRVHDNGCSLKAYRARVIKGVPLYSEMHRFIPALSVASGASITEVVVRHHPRRFGVSKYGLSRTFKVLLDVIAVRTVMRCTDRPLHWFFVLSLPFGLVGLGSLLIWLVSLPIGTAPLLQPVFPVVCMLFWFLAAHLVFVGLLAELIIRKRGIEDVVAIGHARRVDAQAGIG